MKEIVFKLLLTDMIFVVSFLLFYDFMKFSHKEDKRKDDYEPPALISLFFVGSIWALPVLLFIYVWV